jgi:hypothetical protein
MSSEFEAATLKLLLALTAVREGSGQLVLREVEDRDLGVLFEHSRDREAIRMAAFTSPEADERTTFASFVMEGHRDITYWIGREDWGRAPSRRMTPTVVRPSSRNHPSSPACSPSLG